MEKQTVDVIHFNTDDSKLKSLYTRMAPWIVRRFKEFEFKGKIEHDGITQFTYIKKGSRI